MVATNIHIGLILVVVGYLLGAIPFGLLVARLVGAGDIRQQGSGNIGATNVLRAAGKVPGAIALLLDMAKGALPVVVAMQLLGRDSPWVIACGLAAFLGHLFPVYLHFRGGKGVATALGVWLAWSPWLAGGLMLLWLVTAKVSRISSLSALVAFALLPLVLWFIPGATLQVLAVAILMVVLIFWKHQENIRRLLAGTEPRIGRKE